MKNQTGHSCRVSLLAFVTALFALTSCGDSSNISGTTGLARVVLGAKVNKIKKRDPFYRNLRGASCQVGYIEKCYNYLDTRNRAQAECTKVYNSCRNHRWALDFQTTAATPLAQSSSDAEVALVLAREFQIPARGVKKLLSLLAQAQLGRLPTQSLGLTRFEWQELLETRKLSKTKLLVMGDQLGTSAYNLEKFIRSLNKEYVSQGRNVKSTMWRYCLLAPRWNTDLVLGCRDLRSSGCSPQTGASYCSP